MGKAVDQVLKQTGAPSIKGRLTEEDYATIRNTFNDNWETLKIVRDLMFGFTLSDFEKKAIRELSPQAKEVIRKEMLPVLDRDIPIGATTDLWMTIHLADKDEFSQKQIVKTREVLISMLEEGLKLLDNPDGVCPLGHTDTEVIENLMARNTYLVHIEQQLVSMHLIAYTKQPTPEELDAKRKKDSGK